MKALLHSIHNHQSNPSTPTPGGTASKAAIASATKTILGLLGEPDGTIIYTSSGTESIHTAITIMLKTHNGGSSGDGSLPHIVASAADHPGAYNALLRLRDEKQITLTLVSLDETGTVSSESLLRACRSQAPDLITLLHAHNELGTVQSLDFLAEVRKSFPRALVHVDASQSLSKADHSGLQRCDMVTITGHKHGAPKGISALYVAPSVVEERDLSHFRRYGGVLLAGGGQNGGLRSSTENVPYIVALAKSLEVLCGSEFAANQEKYRKVCAAIVRGLGDDTEYEVNCASTTTGISNLLSLSFVGVGGAKALVGALQENHGITIAAGSACDASKGMTASRTLQNLPGVSEEVRLGTVRISCGWWNSEDEGLRAGRAIREEVGRLRGGEKRKNANEEREK